jgi:hypothetical protein
VRRGPFSRLAPHRQRPCRGAGTVRLEGWGALRRQRLNVRIVSGLPKSLCRVRCGGSNRCSAAVSGTRNELKLLAVKFARR